MSPNLALAHWQRGATLIFSGRPRAGLDALETCIRLDPRDPYLAVRLLHVACGLYLCSEYEASIEAAKRLIRSFPDFPMIYRWPAAALGQLDRTAEAKEWLEKAIAAAPAAFNMYVLNRVPWFRPEDHAHLVEGLRKAGDLMCECRPSSGHDFTAALSSRLRIQGLSPTYGMQRQRLHLLTFGRTLHGLYKGA